MTDILSDLLGATGNLDLVMYPTNDVCVVRKLPADFVIGQLHPFGANDCSARLQELREQLVF